MPHRADMSRAAAETKRAELLRATRKCVARSGFAGTTVAAIAREGGVSVGSVYSYFDTRELLLAEVFRSAAGHELQTVATAVAAAGDTATAQLCALVDTFAYRALRGRQMAWSLLFEPVMTGVDVERLAFRRSYRTLGEQIIRHGIAAGEFVPQDPQVSSAAVMGAISEALVGALSPLADRDATAHLADSNVVDEIRLFCIRALRGLAD